MNSKDLSLSVLGGSARQTILALFRPSKKSGYFCARARRKEGRSKAFVLTLAWLAAIASGSCGRFQLFGTRHPSRPRSIIVIVGVPVEDIRQMQLLRNLRRSFEKYMNCHLYIHT